MARKPRLAVWKFASCDGCQLTLLDCEDELLQIAEALEIAYFKEATPASERGLYDLSLVDGSISTSADAQRILAIRRSSRRLVAIGACAIAGGIQSLRNFADASQMAASVYPCPAKLDILATSKAIRAHVPVELELPGCPIDKRALLEVLSAFLVGRKPVVPGHSVCLECKVRGNICVMVGHGTPCMGPVTRAGCGALCPAYERGCYGCFGPMETPNTASLIHAFRAAGWSSADVTRAFRSFNADAEQFRRAARPSNDD
ncbi:MAG: oxidoreductase [Deltaproteobacteria bacterium]|nr:oxidoreductase [Deltaproteobacteria bacterium]